MSNKVPKHQPSLRSTYAERAQAAAHEAASGERRRRRLAIIAASAVGVLALVALVAVLVARSGTSAPPVSEEAVQLGCISCHSSNGQRSEGPTWKGLAGSTVQLADGTTVIADDDYLRRSITDPQAQIVAGYAPGMPTVEVTDAQLDALVAYIDSLS